MEIWGADVGNAYLEAKTKEKLVIIAGPMFGELEGHTLIIHKAIYGLKSSGLRWREKFAETLKDMGFFPSKADDDVWMKDCDDHYEYIATYVDDLLIASRDPEAITRQISEDYGYKLKGVGPIKYHLGCDFWRDQDGHLNYGPHKFISKMMEKYERDFGEKPGKGSSPLVQNDHPEIDTSAELNDRERTIYMSMIGSLQWCITLGRFDIFPAVMTMSRFHQAPRQGHLDRVKRIYGYLLAHSHGAIRVVTGKPDYSDLPDETYDWMYSVYGDCKEIIDESIPHELGNSVTTTTFVDANLHHDLLTGRACTGALHLVNGTPGDWFSKRQDTVETATYGSEFVAARIATEQIIDLRQTLRYLGVPVEGSAYMFGDNQSVITSSTLPHSKLSKRHNALAYHRVREAIAAKVLKFYFISGKQNPADLLSKHGGWSDMWKHIQPLLFWFDKSGKPKGKQD